MCNTTSGVNGSLAWELIIGIDEPARKSKISRQKYSSKDKRRGFPLFLVVKTWFDCWRKSYKSQRRKSTCLSDLNC